MEDELNKEEKQSGSSTETELIAVYDQARVALLEIKIFGCIIIEDEMRRKFWSLLNFPCLEIVCVQWGSGNCF